MWSLMLVMMIVIQLRPTEFAASNTSSGAGANRKRQRSSDSSHDDEMQVVPQGVMRRTPIEQPIAAQNPTPFESSLAAGETQKKRAKSVLLSATENEVEPVDMKSVNRLLARSKSVPHDTTDVAQEEELGRKLCRLHSDGTTTRKETLLVKVCKLVFEFEAVVHGGNMLAQGGKQAPLVITEEEAAGWVQERKQDLVRIDKEVQIVWPLGFTDQFPREKEIIEYNAQFRHESGFSVVVQAKADAFVCLIKDCKKGEFVRLAEQTLCLVHTLLRAVEPIVSDYFEIAGQHLTDFIIHQMSKVAFDRAAPKNPYSLANLNICEKDDTAESMDAD